MVQSIVDAELRSCSGIAMAPHHSQLLLALMFGAVVLSKLLPSLIWRMTRVAWVPPSAYFQKETVASCERVTMGLSFDVRGRN